MSKEREPASGATEGARRATGEAPEERGDGRGRWSAKRKMAAVLRLLRGEDIETLSRETGRDCGHALRLAGAVAGRHGSELESAGSRCRERRNPAAEIVSRRSEHEQRTAAGENPPPGGRTPFGLAEAEAMSRAASPFTGRRYGVVCVTREWEMARSSFYHQRAVAAKPDRILQRRGPKTAWSDGALLEKIREVIVASPFHGEGHRKVWARLRFEQVRTSKARVLRLMREAQLLAPSPRSRSPRILTPARSSPRDPTKSGQRPHPDGHRRRRPSDRVCSGGSLHHRMRGPARGPESHALRGPGTTAPGSARLLRRISRRRGGGHPQPARSRQPVHE
jgi:HTH-like domain